MSTLCQQNNRRLERKVKIVCISDTHEQHRKVKVPDGDLLIHAGDITNSGDPLATADFFFWLNSQPHKHKVVIAGNHDFFFDKARRNTPKHYYQNERVVIDGLKIWASPITPTYGKWAFMADRGEEIKLWWDMIPDDTDILITHGPPAGKLDEALISRNHPSLGTKNEGCLQLADAVLRIKPKLHVFGHIHRGYGKLEQGGTIFVNASTCNENYDAVNPPIVIDL